MKGGHRPFGEEGVWGVGQRWVWCPSGTDRSVCLTGTEKHDQIKTMVMMMMMMMT